MTERRRILVLIVIMSVSSLIIAGISMSALYHTAFETQKARLVVTAKSMAHLMEAAARFDTIHSSDYPGGASEATISQIVDAYSDYTGFEKTGEFTLAKRQGNNIVYLMKNQPGSEHISIPFDSNLGEPMRRALSGLSGVMVGPDYMGKTVLAAYEPVAVLNLGIVTKIDIDEVREPFIKAGLITLFFTILIVLFSAGLFIRITRPMITQLEQRVIERTAELSDINYILEKEIVERRRAENALKESEERYKRLSDLTFEGILFHKDGIIIDFNQSFINLTGYHREELPGKNAVSLLVPEKYHPIVRQNMVKKIACPYEIEIIKKNGILVPIELRARDIVSDGREMRVVALRDISKRKKAEDELRNALLYTRSLIEASLDPLVTISVNGKITDLNKATEWVTGFSKEQLIGSDFADYFTEPGKATAGYQQVFEKENVRDYPLELRHRNGTITPVIYNASVYRDEYGKVIGVFAAARDISIRRRMERELIRAKEAAEAANLAKSEFIAHLSHELRTPLNGILGYTQILKRDIHLTDKQSEDIAIIQRSAEHLLLLINDLLDFSKIEAGKLELGNADIDLPELLKITADIASVQALQKGIVFVCEVSSELPRKVCGDQKRLRQVLLNLLGNAVKFTEKGSVTFKTELSFPDHEHVLIRFQVEDTGIGIPPSQIEKIFEPFHQINTIGMKNEGTGLGLAICRKLVRSMGGELYVSSVEGHGSVFRFEIKLLRAGEEMVHVNKKTICLPEPEQEVAAPPKEELIRLLEVLKTGDVVAIQAYTEQLKRPDSEFAFFGEKVYKLAKTLQLKQIKRLILQLTEHKT